MAVKKYKPTTPGQRNKVISAFTEITAKKPHKSLLEPLHGTGGRNNTGQLTMRYIGGGHKKMYRVIDFLRDKTTAPLRFAPSSTIPTVPPALLSFSTKTANIATSSLPKD